MTRGRRPSRPESWEGWGRALALLVDGASYTEAAKTVGVERKALSQRFPGYGWTQKQGGAYGRMIRDANIAELKNTKEQQ